ncbi:prenyltransferase/squalene oxidase repeat-containing protein [Nocardioides marmoribigeumensis]|jgi:hypothetical protein|uniref:Terpene cyclase/mutase family protein n=1 Tax=Nocardioides marmoribigeumensis TaxID=433649 RepID=A0ABU2C0R4_9ACTN|nr:terpene cyclase/mutase family protein [Nocardioides marmoribigeumensis]MDR7364267.1 hypothetical protein [Nocardioides marmoribigeumensis]
MSHLRARTRAPRRALLVSGTVLGLALAAVPAQALTAADVETGATAGSRSADYLSRQLGKDDLVHGEYEYPAGTWNPTTDHGLSLDLVYAFRRLGGHAAEQRAILDAMAGQADAYTGQGAYAGPLGKLVQVAVSAGRDIDSYAGGKLDDELRDRVVTGASSEHGRAKDRVDPTDQYSADYSNTIGQAFVVRAFAALHDGLLDDTTAFLLQQQCAAGWFREGMDGADHTCDGAPEAQRSPSVDATAHGIRALLAARAAGVKGLTDDIDDAVSWLVRRQRIDGSFVGNGVANANSTGLAAYALASTGHPGPAGTAAAWVRRHQVDGLTIKQHPRLKGYNGSVAYSDTDLADGKKDGVSRGAKRTWQRAAAEGALALPSLLPRRTLGFVAPDRAPRGSRVTVTIRGLKPGERWAVRQAGVVLAQGRVPATGRVVAQVRMPDRRARVTLRAVGSRVSRTATQAVTLR